MTPTSPSSAPKPPAGLGAAGRNFWRAGTAEVVGWTPADLAVLGEACAIKDTIAMLSKALVGTPLIVMGANGQDRENPLLSELRQQRSLYLRAVKQIGLPDDVTTAEVRRSHASASARALARQRWG